MTEFDKQCMSTIKDIQNDIDQDLDIIGDGIAALKEMAEAMGEELDVQDQMLKEVSEGYTLMLFLCVWASVCFTDDVLYLFFHGRSTKIWTKHKTNLKVPTRT